MNQENLFDARAARDDGIALTSAKNSNWLATALKMIPIMKSQGGINATTGEGIRMALTLRGLPQPSSPHAWGMLTRTAMKAGLIRDTGRLLQMVTKKSHARRTPLWEIV